MKKIILSILFGILTSLNVLAQKADDIIGNYQLDYNNKQSKVKIFKYENGYRAQNYWAREGKNEDGSIKYDVKNPDKTKRSVAVSNVVLIDKLIFDGAKWCDSKIYDPTSGRYYTVEIRIKDAKSIEVRGKVGPFYKNLYWTRIK